MSWVISSVRIGDNKQHPHKDLRVVCSVRGEDEFDVSKVQAAEKSEVFTPGDVAANLDTATHSRVNCKNSSAVEIKEVEASGDNLFSYVATPSRFTPLLLGAVAVGRKTVRGTPPRVLSTFHNYVFIKAASAKPRERNFNVASWRADPRAIRMIKRIREITTGF